MMDTAEVVGAPPTPKTLEQIGDEVVTALIRDARTHGLQMKDVRLPEFQDSVALLRDLVADWLEDNMEIEPVAVRNGRAA